MSVPLLIRAYDDEGKTKESLAMRLHTELRQYRGKIKSSVEHQFSNTRWLACVTCLEQSIDHITYYQGFPIVSSIGVLAHSVIHLAQELCKTSHNVGYKR